MSSVLTASCSILIPVLGWSVLQDEVELRNLVVGDLPFVKPPCWADLYVQFR